VFARSDDRTASLAAGVLVGAAILLRLRPLQSLDLWWHLSMGRLVRSEGARSFEDPLSWGVGHPYRDPEWLFDLAALAVWDLGGVGAVVALTALLAGISAALAWLLARELAGPDRPWAAVVVAALAVGGSSWRFDPRPQSLFLVLLPATMLLAARARATHGRARWGWLIGLVATLALWSQSHSSMVIAPAVALAMCLPRGDADAPWSGPQLALLAGLCVVPLLGPFGLGVIDQVFGHAGSDAARHITDMRPMPLAGWWPRPGSSVLYVELLLVTGIGAGLYSRRLPPGPLLLAGLGLAMTLTAHRFRAAWALMLIPLAGAALREAPAWLEERRAVALAVVVLVPLAIGHGEPGPSLRWDRTSVPADATGAMASLEVRGRLFNDYDGGGWVGWQLGPDVQVFIDGRTPTHFDGERFAAARAGYEGRAGFDPLHAEHRFDAVLIRRDQGLCADLEADPDWEVSWFGERRALFQPAAAVPRPVRRLSPCTHDSSVRRCIEADEGSGRALAEVDRLRALDPAHGYLDRLGVALALHCGQDLSAAADHLDQARRFDGGHADLPRFAARIQLALDRPEQALRWLQAAPASDVVADDLELRVLRVLDRPADALPLARARVSQMGDRAPGPLLSLLAWACHDAGDTPCVVTTATRAALLGDADARALLDGLQATGELPPTHRRLLDAAR